MEQDLTDSLLTKKIVFICGLHRSGTSLLHRCLKQHPDISGFENTGVSEDEGQHLQTVYPPAKAFGGPGKFGFDPRAYMDESSPLVTHENRIQLMREWIRYWDISKSVLIEKSPPNLIRTRFLQAMFPNAWFITLIRHPVAVAFATQKWSKTFLYNLIKHWIITHNAFMRDKPHLKRVRVIRYSDFIWKPHQTLEGIYRFLDIPVVRTDVPINHNIYMKYFIKWEKYRNSILTRFIARKIIRDFEQAVNRFGYSFYPPYHLPEQRLPS